MGDPAVKGASAKLATLTREIEAEEFDRCRPCFVRELALLPNVRVVLALGGLAWTSTLRVLAELRRAPRSRDLLRYSGTAPRPESTLPKAARSASSARTT